MTKPQAKKIIRDLIDATRDCCLVDHYDGGKNVDVVFSQFPGKSREPMSLNESESRLDAVLKRSYKALTGEEIEGDPVEFING